MNCGMKRKWDGLDMDFAPQLGSAGPSASDCGSFVGSETPTEAWSWQGRTTVDTDPDDMDMEDRDQGQDDIPTTAEVINSLRKVILWMSAQDDHNNDYIQYLTDVEHYALSKQPNIQQRKITQYFIRRD
ncbi:uncharacterized protein LOC106662254 isoform X2 [Cimex lectularius]|uniref:Uncharacterized protein n=1 Tax=Cimex lectularius TaxID=79782 RepID=A0A8I6REE1_CIMLE|nr:uncharacterized protein LOC106662254 isoform X2 [Cimex lectularius]XP_014241679.1 uncharacterized protein LOC106662254 isoform X2 [Cimex lectularius]